MNFIKNITISILSCSLIFMACTKKIDGAYLNPNSPVKVPPELLLAPMEYNMALNLQSDFRIAIGPYIQFWFNRLAGNDFDRMGYTPASDAGANIWRMHYWLIGQNCNRMIDWATDEKKWDYVGVGKAIQAWSWLTLTDVHGEVILKEAFNTGLQTFHYDTQPEVYDYVRLLAFQALDNLNKTGDGVDPTNLAKGDAYLNGGNVDKWKKFVYGILARSYNHLSNKSDYKPDSVLFYANKAMQITADDATVKFAFNGQNDAANFFGPYRGNIGTMRQSKFIVDLETGNNPAFSGADDPRKWYYLQLDSANTTFRGLDPGVGESVLDTLKRPRNFWGSSSTSANQFPATDINAKYLFRDNAEFPIMTATEIHFIKSEAAFRKGDKIQSLAEYRLGIEESFNMLTSRFNQNIPSGNQITSANKATYISAVMPSSAGALSLTQIMLQKYIALWGYGATETWVDMRRYHYLDIDPMTGQQVYANFTPPSVSGSSSTSLYPDNGGKPVFRIRPRYNSEYVWNLDELKRIGANNIDYQTLVPWFAKP